MTLTFQVSLSLSPSLSLFVQKLPLKVLAGPSIRMADKQSYHEKTPLSEEYVHAAMKALSATPEGSRSTGDTALKTPSWTSIVEAYHQEGNGDREMLLALLHAKAKEDER